MPEMTLGEVQSERWTRYETGDGHIAYVLTGIVPVTVKGSGKEWKWQDVKFNVPIPGLTGSERFDLIHWAPFVTPCWISNDNTAVNAGWAVQYFDLLNAAAPQVGRVEVECTVGVRDVDGYINGLGFNIALVGDEVTEEGSA